MNTLKKLLTWILGIFFCICGIKIVGPTLISGSLVFFSGLVLIPPVWEAILARITFTTPKYFRFIIFILFFLTGLFVFLATPKPSNQKIAQENVTVSNPEPTVQPSPEIQVSPEPTVSPTPVLTPSPKPIKSPKTSPVPSPLPESSKEPEKTTFDSSLGNTKEAAEFATKVVMIFESAVPDSIKNIYVNEMSASLLIDVTLDSTTWNGTSDSDKKDLVSVFVTSAHNEFPDKVPHITVKTPYRTVAKGDWDLWSGETKVELK